MQEQDLDKSYTFVLTQPRANKQPFYPPNTLMCGESKVRFTDPKTGDVRERYAIYLPSATSIWADEITSLRDVANPKGQTINIVNGVKVINSRESNLLKFFRVAGMNEANDKTRIRNVVVYRELNQVKKAEEVFDNMKQLDNARYFVSNQDIKEVRAYALALSKTASEVSIIQQMSEYELRLHLRQVAERNPATFIEGMKDLVLINKVKIIQAIYDDTIISNEKDGSLSWKDGSEFLVAPKGMSAVQYLAEMSVKSEKHLRMLQDIEEGGSRKPKSETKKPTSKKQEEEEEDFDDKVLTPTGIEMLIEKAIEEEHIYVTANKVWHIYKRDMDGELKFKGRKELSTELEQNDDFRLELEALIQK